MRHDNTINPGEEKRLARQKYAERQFDKWIKWSFEIRGKIKYKDIIEMQEQLNIITKQNKL
jgi:hypothetical protein